MSTELGIYAWRINICVWPVLGKSPHLFLSQETRRTESHHLLLWDSGQCVLFATSSSRLWVNKILYLDNVHLLSTWAVIKGIQWFCVKFTNTILVIVVFAKTIETKFSLFPLFFQNLKIRPVGLWKISHGSTNSPSWLCEESIMALQGVRHGSTRRPPWLWEKSVTVGYCQ